LLLACTTERLTREACRFSMSPQERGKRGGNLGQTGEGEEAGTDGRGSWNFPGKQRGDKTSGRGRDDLGKKRLDCRRLGCWAR